MTKEIHHGRSNKIHLTAHREDQLLRNLRLLFLFLRVPGQCLSMRANQLPMRLPQAHLQSVGRLCPAHRNPVGGAKAEPLVPRCLPSIVTVPQLTYHGFSR